MRFVVASAFRNALGRLLLLSGLVTVLFTLVARGGFTGRLPLPALQSPWDYPFAIGIAAASVVAAVLLNPKRTP